MYKTTVYRLVNGSIAHQKQQISDKGDIARQYLGNVLLRSVTFIRYLLFLM